MQINVGDTVRLAPEVTALEFGLALCDDDGLPIEIDAEVIEVGRVYIKVKILRMMRLTRFTAPQEMAVTRLVRPEQVLDVLSHSPSIWPNAAGLKAVSDEREGKVKRQSEPVLWTVGVDEIPR